MMKISLVIPSFYPATVYGGPIFTSLQTAEALARLSIEIRVSTTNANMTKRLDITPDIWHKHADNLFIKYYDETVIHKFSLSMFLGLYGDIKASDLVHIQSLFNPSSALALFYAYLLNRKVLLTPHGALSKWGLKNSSFIKTLWLKYLIKPYNKTTLWHATAQMEKDEILTVFPNAKVMIIPNGINYEYFQNASTLTREEYMKKFTQRVLKTEKIIISMGRLQKKKGFDILIKAFTKVLSEYPDAKLLIAGEDEGEEKNLRGLINKLNLSNTVFLTGLLEGQNKVDFLANADLFVLPSHNENFGMVYAESLAAGTPIIAGSNTPWSAVEKANCGKWLSTDTADETAAMILKMLLEKRELMSKNSKNLAQQYDWNIIVLQFKEIFERMQK